MFKVEISLREGANVPGLKIEKERVERVKSVNSGNPVKRRRELHSVYIHAVFIPNVREAKIKAGGKWSRRTAEVALALPLATGSSPLTTPRETKCGWSK